MRTGRAANSGHISPALIADLYDAAVSSDGLGPFAELVGSHLGVEGAALVLTRDGKYLETFSSEIIREQSHLYAAYYHRLDPWRSRGGVPGRDRVVLANELFPESELVRTEFYRDFARPMGMFRPMSAYLSLGDGELAALGVEQPFAPRLFEQPDKARLEALVPYLKRALQLRLRLRLATLKAEIGLGGLEALALGIVMADATGRVVFANSAAESMSARQMGLSLHSGQVFALADDETRRLHDALARVAAGQAPDGTIRLSGPAGEPVAVALVSAVPAPSATGGFAPVMITVRPLDEPPAPSPTILRTLFDLSPRQAEIALDLMAGRSVEEIAADRDIKVATVRYHLSEIFQRCGVESQRTLLRALAAIPGLRPASPARN